MRSVFVSACCGRPGSLRAKPGRPAGHRRHPLRSGARRHHGGRQLRAELGGLDGGQVSGLQDHGRDRPAGASATSSSWCRMARADRCSRRAPSASARSVECRRALGRHVGRAGHGDGPQHRRRRALGIPDGLSTTARTTARPPPPIPTRRRCRASAAPTPTTWARCWPARAMPRSAARPDRPTPRSTRGDRPLSRGQGARAQHHRHDRRPALGRR